MVFSNQPPCPTDKETDMKNQFWAGLGSRAVLVKKKFGADYEQLLRPVFLCFHGQKIKSKFVYLYSMQLFSADIISNLFLPMKT